MNSLKVVEGVVESDGSCQGRFMKRRGKRGGFLTLRVFPASPTAAITQGVCAASQKDRQNVLLASTDRGSEELMEISDLTYCHDGYGGPASFP